MIKPGKGAVEQLSSSTVPELSLSEQFVAHVQEASLVKFAAVTLQLGLTLFVIYLFRIEESSGFLELLPLIFGGFVVHAWLPLKLRQPFFFLLTVAGVVIIFGSVNALWLTGISLLIIGCCHLPAAFWVRIALICIIGAGLAVLRAEWISLAWSGPIIAVLGSMFMFRVALYLYDLKNEKKKATVWERLCYFFMLPNIVFPFFPIVDYINYRRTYYNEDSYSIYQKGVLWMLRGAIHLILYRVVYYFFTPALEEIHDLGGVILFIVSAYLLYLRVSGLFHLIIGIMCLFGFNLPETHKQYFLASSFNDYWRRINIYWKDFMMKLFFYPLYMKTRHWGATTALVFSTLVVFVCTWLLHSYQWFWLQGDFPLTAVDGVYWLVLGVLVAGNSVWEAKKGKRKRLSRSLFDGKSSLKLGLQTVLTFVFLSVMWSFWSSESVSSWWSVMGAAGSSGVASWMWLLAALVGLWGALFAFEWLKAKNIHLFFDERKMSFESVALRTAAIGLVLAFVALPQVKYRLGHRVNRFITSVQETRLNKRDQDLADRGYYEGLMSTSYTSQLSWAEETQRPANWKATMNSESVQPGEGMLVYELIPSFDGIVKEAPFKTNRWGMRDKEYSREKPEDVYRIALLGASYEQGSGVTREETFEALVEAQLNASRSEESAEGYEILNFAVGGYSPVQNLVVAERKALAFDPNAIYYAIHSTEKRRMLMQLERMILDERLIDNPELKALLANTGVRADMEQPELRRRLDPVSEDILAWSLRSIKSLCDSEGIPFIVLYIPTTEERDRLDPLRAPVLTKILEEAEITTLFIDDPYAGHSLEEIQLRSWDTHLSKKGHELVANRLYDTLIEHRDAIKLGHMDN